MFDQRKIVLALDPDPKMTALARRAVRRLIGEDAPINFTHDAVLLTSELITNVTRHTNGGCRFTACFERTARRLRVDITDTSTTVPTVVEHGSERGGWGLRLVAQIATRWGATLSRTGKTVWFELEPSAG